MIRGRVLVTGATGDTDRATVDELLVRGEHGPGRGDQDRGRLGWPSGGDRLESVRPAMLVNAIGTVATSPAGPLHLSWPGEPFTAIAAWPVVSVPALLAPIGIFLHVVSIRQSIASLAERGGLPNVTESQLPDINVLGGRR